MADAQINGIEFEVQGSAESAANSLEKLSQSLSAIKSATKGGLGLKAVIKDLQELGTASATVDSQRIEAFAEAMRGLGKTKISRGFASSLSKISRAVGNFDSERLTSISDAVRSLASGAIEFSPTMGQGLADVTQYLTTISSIDFTNLNGAVQAIERIAQAANVIGGGAEQAPIPTPEPEPVPEQTINAWTRLGDAILSVGKSATRLGLKALIAPFKSSIKDVSQYAKKLGEVASGFKRILGYRLMRSLIKEIGKAFREGTQNLYAYSAAIGGPFAANMDRAATSMLYFKNSVGAAWSPLMNLLAPALDAIVDKVVAVINVVNQLIALLTGQSGWTRAVKNATEYGDAVGGAGGKAKEALKYLAPFDELNVLPDDKTGGGGGGSALDYGSMFEEMTEFERGIAEFATRIKDAIERSDWQGLGTMLGEKINEIVEKIDFAGAGVKVGDGVRAWFTTKYWALKVTDFEGIGAKIAEFLNNAIAQINFETIGRSLAQKFTILPDMIIGLLGELDWSRVGKSIGDFIRGAFDEFSEWLDSKDWNKIGEDLVNGLVDMLNGLDTGKTAASIVNFLNSAWNAAKNLLSGIWKTAFGGGTFDTDVAVNLNVSEASFKPGSATITNDMMTGMLGALVGGLIGVKFGIVGGIIGMTIGLAVGLSVNGIDYKDVTGKGAAAVQAYIEALDERFKDAKPGTYEYQYYQKLRNRAITELGQAGEDAGSSFRETLEEGFSGRSGKIDSINVEVNGNVVLTKGTDKIPTKDKTTTGWAARHENIKRKWASNLNWTTTGWTARMDKYSLSTKLQNNGIDIKARVVGQTNTPTLNANIKARTVSAQAEGGVFSGGVWHNIARYASGGLAKGSQLFWAREKGPELVGTLGGHTAVMNNNQIVASVSAGVAKAIAGIRFQLTGLPAVPALATESDIQPKVFSAVTDAMSRLRFQIPSAANYEEQSDAESEDMMYRAFSRALSEVDFDRDIDLDGDVVYRKMVQRNRQNTRMTGVNAMA